MLLSNSTSLTVYVEYVLNKNKTLKLIPATITEETLWTKLIPELKKKQTFFQI